MPQDNGIAVLKAIGAAIGVSAVVVALGLAGPIFEPYRFVAGAGEKAVTVLGSLFIVALFVERAQEVYIKVWRGIGRIKLDQEVDRSGAYLKALEAGTAATPQEKTDAGNAVELATHNVQDYRAETRKITFIGGMILGVAIALVGPRLLAEIMEPWGEPGFWQTGIFDAVDVIITGGLIGGGSDGIHKLVSLVTDFLDETRDRMTVSRADGGQAGKPTP